MHALIRLALRYRQLTLLLALVILVAGWRAWVTLPIDAFPEISPTQTKIILKVPGMTPEEIEQRVVKPLEQSLLSIPKKRIVRSVSKYGIADITLDFEEGVDIYWARQQVSEHLASLMPSLPRGVDGGLAPITTPLSEMFMFTLESDQHTLAEKRRVLEWVIRPELRTVPGVADVNSLGGEVQTFEIVPDATRMARQGITLSDLREAITANNLNDGAGRLTSAEQSLAVRIEGAIRSLEDVRSIRITSSARGSRVLLDEVATVRLGQLSRYGATTHDGQGETVQGLVLGLRGVNARQLVESVQARLLTLQDRLPSGMRIQTFYNRGQLVERAASTVIHALAEAAVLVCVVLYLFLGGVRAALVVALSLPMSLLATFLLMHAAGISANLMSLGGLAVALGMLVDASVVVVENIEARLATHAQAQAQDATMSEIVLHAVKEVVTPVVAGVLIIGIVFLPLLTLQDLEGKLFGPVALTIVMALGASLVLSLTVIPVLASMLLHPQGAHEPRWMQHLTRGYARLRDAAWAHARWLWTGTLLSLVLAFGLYTQVGKTFMPVLDEGDVLVQLQKSASISLDAALSLDTRVQQAILAQVPEVKAIVARAGSDELGLDPMGLNETDTFLVLKPKDEWRGNKESIIDALRTVLEGFPGLIYSFTQPIEMRVSEMLTGTRGDVAIKVFGQDLAEMNRAAQHIATAVRAVPGAAEVIAPKAEGMSYLSVAVRRHTAGQAGLHVEQIQQALKAQIEGETLGVVLQDGMRIPLTIKGSEALRHSPQALRTLPITAPDGKVWLAETLADIALQDGPIRIDHEQSQRLAIIQVTVEGRDLASFVQAAQQAVSELRLSNQLRVVWGGQFENQQRASARLALVIPATMGLIFLVLSLTFGSALQAGIIFLNIPFALVGGMVALAVSGEYLSVPASVGFIALLGIAVLNGVVMVSHFNERIARGEALHEVVRLGAERRLRPVLMTAVITALGMLPLLFATGPGSEIQRPLAIVVTGGLVSSTLLTLLLLPRIFERWGGYDSWREAWRSVFPLNRGDVA
jgi:CzcA family heavy metal efflux pump